MHYLRWAKLHTRVTYELTPSGVPPLRPADFGVDSLAVSLEVRGGYGDPQVVQAVAKLYGVPPEHVVPVPGTSTANFVALAIAAKRGQSILVENPIYDPLVRAAEFLGLAIHPVQRSSAGGFGVSLDDVAAGLKAGAAAVLFTNLHNPSGQYLPLGRIAEITTLCSEAGAVLIVDEVYLDAVSIVQDSKRWSAASLGDNVVATGSLTKVYGLGGTRAGWLVAAPRLAERARDVMDVLSVENAAPATSVAIHALDRLSDLAERYRCAHTEGQRVYRAWLKDQRQLSGYDNHGALFECVRLPDGVDPDHLNEVLVSDYDTQVVSGRFFGLDGHIRVGTSVAPGVLAEGLARISEAVGKMSPNRSV